jgi:hypothetical protein
MSEYGTGTGEADAPDPATQTRSGGGNPDPAQQEEYIAKLKGEKGMLVEQARKLEEQLDEIKQAREQDRLELARLSGRVISQH